MRSIRIIVADSHPDFREQLDECIRHAPDMEVIGEAADGREAIAVVGQLNPDVLTLDGDMPGWSELDVLEVVRWSSPGTKVIVISANNDELRILEMLRRGARGYMAKEEASDVVRAIRAVHRGEVWVRRRLLAKLIEDLVRVGSVATGTNNC